MSTRMRLPAPGWLAVPATVGGVSAGGTQALGAPDAGLAASPARTIAWPAFPVTPPDAGAALPRGAMVAQSRITAGRLQGLLQGPLNAQGTSGQAARCFVPLRRVVHHRRVAPRAPPVVVAALPVLPLGPACACPPPGPDRPVVPVHALRPV